MTDESRLLYNICIVLLPHAQYDVGLLAFLSKILLFPIVYWWKFCLTCPHLSTQSE